jgi:hypothetical protein
LDNGEADGSAKLLALAQDGDCFGERVDFENVQA